MNTLIETMKTIRTLINDAKEFDLLECPNRIAVVKETTLANIEMLDLLIEVNDGAFPDIVNDVMAMRQKFQEILDTLELIQEEYIEHYMGAAA